MGAEAGQPMTPRPQHPYDRHPWAACALYGAALGTLLVWPWAGAAALALLTLVGEVARDEDEEA